MKCTKAKFRDKRSLETKVNILKKSGQWSRKDNSSRNYYCEECKAWHMTSLMEEYTPALKPINIVVKFKKRWKILINSI